MNAASGGVTFDAPEGTVTVNGENHHIAKTGLIGQINADNQFDIVWSSDGPIEPDPFLEGYDWWDPNDGRDARVIPPPLTRRRGCRAAARHPRPGRSRHRATRDDDLKAARWTYSPPPS